MLQRGVCVLGALDSPRQTPYPGRNPRCPQGSSAHIGAPGQPRLEGTVTPNTPSLPAQARGNKGSEWLLELHRWSTSSVDHRALSLTVRLSRGPEYGRELSSALPEVSVRGGRTASGQLQQEQRDGRDTGRGARGAEVAFRRCIPKVLGWRLEDGASAGGGGRTGAAARGLSCLPAVEAGLGEPHPSGRGGVKSLPA